MRKLLPRHGLLKIAMDMLAIQKGGRSGSEEGLSARPTFDSGEDAHLGDEEQEEGPLDLTISLVEDWSLEGDWKNVCGTELLCKRQS